MSKNTPKVKENGMKAEKGEGKHICPPGPHQHPHQHHGGPHEAGDDSASEAASTVAPVPENIFKRINALKNIHMDVQKIEQEMYTRLFLLEAEQHKKMQPLLQRRADIIVGKVEPSEKEAQFSLKDDEEKPELAAANQEQGIPEFWLQTLSTTIQTAQSINEDDREVLKYLTDVRSVYTESPLGFKLEFEFKENPYFTNSVLTRSYVFGSDGGREDLYISSGLAPKTTEGCKIDWKEGKDTTKKETITYQRNKKTGERRQIKKVDDQESFFQFFQPTVTDLASLSTTVVDETDEEAAEALSEKAEQAEVDFELASFIRTRVIPRALLIYTGDDEDDNMSDYGGEYDEDDDEDDDDEDDEPVEESDSDESGDGGKKRNGPGGKSAKVSKGVARRS